MESARSSHKSPISLANIKVKAYSLVAFLNAITSPVYSYKPANKNPINSRPDSGSGRIVKGQFRRDAMTFVGDLL